MLFAFGRDGFGPKALAHIDPSSGGPRRATWLTVALGVVVNVLCWYTGWPLGATGDPAIDAYFLFAVAGSVCLMVCYLLVEFAAMWFVGAPRFVVVHGGEARTAGLLLPAAGAAVILAVLWFSAKDATSLLDPPLLGLYWCAVGFAIAAAASRIAGRVGAALAAEVGLPSGAEAQVR
jgi:amino acid transporter